jgi:hypothetical protein
MKFVTFSPLAREILVLYIYLFFLGVSPPPLQQLRKGMTGPAISDSTDLSIGSNGGVLRSR